MKREFGVEANVGKPQVAYRETITQAAPGEEKYSRSRPVVAVSLVTSSSRSSRRRARVLCSRTRSPAVRFRGVHQAGRAGHQMRWSVASSPATSWSISRSVWFTAVITKLTRRAWHSRLPVRWRFRMRCRKAKPVLLEPIMRIEVVTPEEYMGAVNGDLMRVADRSRGLNRGRWSAGDYVDACRCRKCLVTRPICVRRRRDAQLRRCTSSVMIRRRRTLLKK